MRVMMGDYLQLVKGYYRVKIEVPKHLPPYLPKPHANKKFLVHSTGVSVRTQARKLGEPWIREFKGAIDIARSAYAAAMEAAALATGTDWERLSCYADAEERAIAEQYYRQIEANRGKPVAAAAPLTLNDITKAVTTAMEAKKTQEVKAPGKGVTFTAVFEKWSRGKSDTEVRNTKTEMTHFAAFIGSDDMTNAARRDFVSYKGHLVDRFHAQEASSHTIHNRWRRLRALYAFLLGGSSMV